MQNYHNFIGIDIGKRTFVVGLHGNKATTEYENTASGIAEFIADFHKELKKGLAVLETTGGHEMSLLLTLCRDGFKVHRANTRHVKNFIRSLGNAAKTDSLDARALALYGYERRERLETFEPQSKQSYELFALIQRRQDLKQMLVAEKNRHKSPGMSFIKESIAKHIECLDEEIKNITGTINKIIDEDEGLRRRKEILKTIPGIGDIVANEFLILLPELGTLTRRQIACLAGVAPRANESGQYKGYRSTGYGRSGIKPILFMAAMSARNSKTELKDYYEKLTGNGKKKMVALVALMRKIIVIANARLRDGEVKPLK